MGKAIKGILLLPVLVFILISMLVLLPTFFDIISIVFVIIILYVIVAALKNA